MEKLQLIALLYVLHHIFVLAFPHAAPDTCFVYFFDFFVHQIVLFFAFLRAP